MLFQDLPQRKQMQIFAVIVVTFILLSVLLSALMADTTTQPTYFKTRHFNQPTSTR